MAMTKCVECGKEISNKAQKCPHCGATHINWASLVFAIIIVGVIARYSEQIIKFIFS